MTLPTQEELTGLALMRTLAPPQTVRHYLLTYISDMTRCMAALEQAVKLGRHDEALDQLHSLKNAFLNGGYQPPAEACLQLAASLSAGGDGRNQIPDLRRMAEETLALIRREPELDSGSND